MCQHVVSRRTFLQRVVLGSTVGASILDLAFRRAAWAQTMAAGAPTNLFDLQKVADGVYFAFAHPQAVTNCNAAVFVNSADVLVVDAHSKPSAAAALIAQIKQEVTTKPVRYLVDTHFHWDHTQGNAGYRDAFGKDLKIIASETSKEMQAKLIPARLQASLDPNGHAFSGQPHIPVLLDQAKKQLSAATDPAQKARLTERIRQLEAFQREMQHYVNVLPTVTFEKTYVIKDSAHDLHVEFHGRGHTGGDVVVFCPQKRVVATGDLILNSLPFMADSYPEDWPKTIKSVAQLPVDFVLGGHGDYQHGKQPMLSEGDYIEELAERVSASKKAGKTVSEIQQSMPVSSIKSLQSNGYGELIRATWRRMNDARANDIAAMQGAVNLNIEDVYNRLGKS